MNYDNLLCYLYLFIHKLLLGCKDTKNIWFMQIIMIFYTSKTHHNSGCNQPYHINIFALQPSK